MSGRNSPLASGSGDERELEGPLPPAVSTTTSPAAAPKSNTSVIIFEDDPNSLQHRSSTVRFRGSKIASLTDSIIGNPNIKNDINETTTSLHIVEQGGSHRPQVLLSQRPIHNNNNTTHAITISTIGSTTFSALFLRSAYTFLAIFYSGILLIFCLQIILFIFMDIVAQGKVDSGSPTKNGLRLVTALLSMPVLVHGLTGCMTLATAFVVDTWRGQRSWMMTPLSAMGGQNINLHVASESISLSMYLGVPMVAAIITLFMGRDDWWRATLLVWFTSVFVLYCVYASMVWGYEVTTCLALVREMVVGDDDRSSSVTLPALIRRAILTVQVHAWSGYSHSTYLVNTQDSNLPSVGDSQNAVIPHRIQTSRYTKLTNFLSNTCCSNCYTKLDSPQHVATFQDLRGGTPVVTSESWSLEKMYCHNYNTSSQAAIIVSGPSAVSRAQSNASFVCTALSKALIVLGIASLLAWMNIPAVLIVPVVIIIVLCSVPNARMTMKRYRMYKDLMEESPGNDDDEETTMQVDKGSKNEQEQPANGTKEDCVALYQISKKHRLTQPTDSFCWTVFALEIAFLYIWPLVALFAIGNAFGGGMFLIFCVFSGCHKYLNPADVLKELGSLDFLDRALERKFDNADDGNDDSSNNESERIKWNAKSRTVDILGHVSRGGVRGLWRSTFWGFAGTFALLACSASIFSTKQNSAIPEIQGSLSDFYYKAQPDLEYPTCELRKGFGIGEEEVERPTSLQDYVYLSSLVYNDPAFYSEYLDKWFGEGFARNDRKAVNGYQTTFWKNSPMRYMLTTFPSLPGLGVVTIRGTVNVLDMFVDMQLWFGASLAQILREVFPFNSIWTPALKDLVTVLSVAETSSLEKHAFYKETGGFVQSLLQDGEINNVIVTGHSLGGGLAMITGAQNGVRSVGISGPNSVLSRGSFDPPVTKEQLDSLTFNVIPDRDLIPMIDDRARLFQEVECRAEKNNLFGCHDVLRTLCAIQFHCGSGNRPAMCACALKFNYPEPLPDLLTQRSFRDACIEEYPPYADDF